MGKKEKTKAEKFPTIYGKERERIRTYNKLPPHDEVELNIRNEGKLIHRLVTKSKTDKFRGGVERPTKNENKISLYRGFFRNIGFIQFFYYKDNPTQMYIGDGQHFDALSENDIRKLWKGVMRMANQTGVIGQYSRKRVKNRINKLRNKKNGA